MTIDVAPARRAEVKSLARVLGRAFYDDPLMTWMMPDDARRARALPRIFAAMTRHHFLAGDATEVAGRDGGLGAAALWDPPGRWRQTPREELRMMPAFLLAMGRQVGRGQAMADLMKKNHPEEPHWYLAVIGSDPTVRGAGFRTGTDAFPAGSLRRRGRPAYLESTKESNIGYYMRFGFEVTGEIRMPDDGPPIWPMWRAPR